MADDATAHVAVYSLNDRQFIIPGVWWSATIPSEGDCGKTLDAMMFGVTTGAKYEWREFPLTTEGNIDVGKVVKGNLLSSAFAHGGFSVWFLSGPEFDAAGDGP